MAGMFRAMRSLMSVMMIVAMIVHHAAQSWPVTLRRQWAGSAGPFLSGLAPRLAARRCGVRRFRISTGHAHPLCGLLLTLSARS
jgi:hypothetical protein